MEPFSVSAVLAALQAIDPRSSTGEDKLPPFFLKLAAPLVADQLLHIFNLSISSSTFPSIWKMAHVLPLHKAGDRKELNIFIDQFLNCHASLKFWNLW